MVGSMLLFFALTVIGFAGPAVVPHSQAPAVKVWDDKFAVVQEFKDPTAIKVIQDIFLRSKRVGDTSSRWTTPTHKIDFSERWLVELKKGEIRVLSKAVVDVYQIEAKDLETLQKLVGTKA